MKPSIPKGTRDFSPQEMLRRNYLFDCIRRAFECFGFLPLETPSMENLSTLMGKYGEEGDKLIFKILNSGDYLEKADASALEKRDSRKLTASISEKALRYDLTVPFARYVVMHQHAITFPFKRYQIQPVWRADRPQKGRYREFYQCDADVIGSTSLLCELELLQLIDAVFSAIGLNVKVLINNRKILSGIAEVLGEADRIVDITVAMDKLDKIGMEKVVEELQGKGVSAAAIAGLEPLLRFSGSNQEKLELLSSMLQNSATGLKGLDEIRQLWSYAGQVKFSALKYEMDLTLARGLNYYTGAIFEVKADDARTTFGSSICGGGRYDDLTGIFGLAGMSGVGISFGADRIADVMDEAGLFPEQISHSTDVLFMHLGEDELEYAVMLTDEVRRAGVKAELYPDAVKMKKQFSYADDRKIPFVVIAGRQEQEKGTVQIKNIISGQQEEVERAGLVAYLRKNIP